MARFGKNPCKRKETMVSQPLPPQPSLAKEALPPPEGDIRHAPPATPPGRGRHWRDLRCPVQRFPSSPWPCGIARAAASFQRFRAGDGAVPRRSCPYFRADFHRRGRAGTSGARRAGGRGFALARVVELRGRSTRRISERALSTINFDSGFQAEAVADLTASDTAAAALRRPAFLYRRSAPRFQWSGRGFDELPVSMSKWRSTSRRDRFRRSGRRALAGSGERLGELVASCQGRLLRDGMTVDRRPAECRQIQPTEPSGRREAAIVTAVPGTTCDVLREQISIDGMPLHVIDTAGLRDSDDPVEREGIHRAWNETSPPPPTGL